MSGFADERKALRIGEDEHRAGVEEELADLVSVIGGVEWNGCVTRGKDA